MVSRRLLGRVLDGMRDDVGAVAKGLRARRKQVGSRAYNLVVLTVSVTLLNIWVAANLPLWSHQIQRTKEAELIFRGMQYAEGIRRFQAKYQRYPTSLKELIEVEPRCMRQLYPNPMREDGRWGIIPVGLQTGNPNDPNNPGGQNPGALNKPDDGQNGGNGGNGGLFGAPPGQDGKDGGVILSADPDDTFARPSTVPIRGVFAAESAESARVFLGKENVGEWKFTVELVSAMKPADPSNPTFQTPFLANEIGRPFPPGVVPQVPQPSDQPQQQNQNPNNPGGPGGPGAQGGPGNAQPGNFRPPDGSGHLGGQGLPEGPGARKQ